MASLGAHVRTISCYGTPLYLVQVALLFFLLSPPGSPANPAETPFEDGTFKLLLTFDESYPNKPPTVKFLSRMFHPNVYANGELCLDILQNRWSPTYDVAAILTSIQSLLHDPNPNSPANAEAAQLYRGKYEGVCETSEGDGGGELAGSGREAEMEGQESTSA